MTGGIIGVSDHGGWAILVTATHDGLLLDRRRVELVDDSLPSLPHHHEGQMMPVDEAVALVERVRTSAQRHAGAALDEVQKAVVDVRGIALRNRQPLPETVAERITNQRARNVADWVMYREALAAAAQERDWPVYWFDPKTVFDSASHALQQSFDARFVEMRKSVGPPWSQDHKLAMAAAIVAAATINP